MWSANDYDKVLISFSGGKDSFACLDAVLSAGVSLDKIELWHQCIDGRDPDQFFMDWPCTEDYVRQLGSALNIPVYYQWRDGGFSREMWRNNQRTAPIMFETQDGEVLSAGGTKGPLGTREMFPQVSANLSVRWCSASLKIDVMATALRNQKRFDNAKTLVVTGERAEESSARAKYADFETDRADARKGRKARTVDHWRPVHAWDEQKVWSAMERRGIVPHPAYQLGFSRLSCMTCIFGSPHQWASVKSVSPERFDTIKHAESKTGKTIHRTRSVSDQVERGTEYPSITEALRQQSMCRQYLGEIQTTNWQLPSGAFGEDKAGPQ